MLRYWESEFEVLCPNKSQKNQRVYTQEDIRKILLIKKLLYQEKYSIEGAKRRIKELKSEQREIRRNSIVDDKELKLLRNKVYDLLQFTHKNSAR